jgi:hypothetical protein
MQMPWLQDIEKILNGQWSDFAAGNRPHGQREFASRLM